MNAVPSGSWSWATTRVVSSCDTFVCEAHWLRRLLALFARLVCSLGCSLSKGLEICGTSLYIEYTYLSTCALGYMQGRGGGNHHPSCVPRTTTQDGCTHAVICRGMRLHDATPHLPTTGMTGSACTRASAELLRGWQLFPCALSLKKWIGYELLCLALLLCLSLLLPVSFSSLLYEGFVICSVTP